jgi:putative colanic acid biosynthesis UDP-glucose lipid carrier transferase
MTFIENNDVEEIYCALPAGDDRKVVPIIHFAEQNLVRCFLIPDFKRFIRKKVSLSFMEEIPVISMRTEPLLKFGNQVEKRIFDWWCFHHFLNHHIPITACVSGPWNQIDIKRTYLF